MNNIENNSFIKKITLVFLLLGLNVIWNVSWLVAATYIKFQIGIVRYLLDFLFFVAAAYIISAIIHKKKDSLWIAASFALFLVLLLSFFKVVADSNPATAIGSPSWLGIIVNVLVIFIGLLAGVFFYFAIKES